MYIYGTKQEKHQPVAETTIDDTNNNMGGLAGLGVTSPRKTDDKKNKSGASQETDIDGYGDDKQRELDQKNDGMNRNDDHRKSDKHDDDKKKDKSKRKESDKSKDKKSGFFGRLKSPKDKDSKKGKGRDSDSAPSSPTSPDSLDKVKSSHLPALCTKHLVHKLCLLTCTCII